MEYIEKEKSIKTIQQKKRKAIEKELQKRKEEYPDILKDVEKWKELDNTHYQLQQTENKLTILEGYINEQIKKLCNLLQEEGFIKFEDDKYISCTTNGTISSHIAEVHGPIWIQCMVDKWNYFEDFSAKQLVGLFSCVTDVKLGEDYETHTIKTEDVFLKGKITEMKSVYDKFEREEEKRDIRTGIKYEEAFSCSIIDETMKWCDCQTEEECKQFISQELIAKGISLGDFTKAIMKIATISKEFRSLYMN